MQIEFSTPNQYPGVMIDPRLRQIEAVRAAMMSGIINGAAARKRFLRAEGMPRR